MRTFCLVTNIVGPHQVPLAQQLAAMLGENNFRYVATLPADTERERLGWREATNAGWLLRPGDDPEDGAQARAWMRESDVVLCGNRDLGLLAARAARKLTTLYMAERWFKPPIGAGRLLHPGFLHMALRFRRLARSPSLHHLAIGAQAARDLRHVAPFHGRTWLWGYFVAPSSQRMDPRPRDGPLRVLWAGRMLGWKHVDVLIRSVAACRQRGGNVALRIVGLGPREGRLRHLAHIMRIEDVTIFEPPVPIAQVREILRQTDVYVLPSDGREGWGVALNEAMIEGVCVVASSASGAAQALVRDGENGLLFKPGDVRALADCLMRVERDESLRQRLAAAGRHTVLRHWTPEIAAKRLLAFSEALADGRRPPAYIEGPLQRL